MFENRKYRSSSKRKGLVPFTVTVKETNLHIQADSDLSKTALNEVLKQRGFVESYINIDPEFAASFAPLEPAVSVVPQIIKDMIDASKKAGVGPMASIAGAVAEKTGKELLKYSSEVIVENGGDIFFKINSDMVFTIFAGKSPLSMRVGVRIFPQKENNFLQYDNNADLKFCNNIRKSNDINNNLLKLEDRFNGMAICTSSGTIGHSISFGKADAAVVIAESCSLADAAATALGNIVKKESDIEKAIEAGQQIEGVMGIVIIKGKKLGAWGGLELVNIN